MYPLCGALAIQQESEQALGYDHLVHSELAQSCVWQNEHYTDGTELDSVLDSVLEDACA